MPGICQTVLRPKDVPTTMIQHKRRLKMTNVTYCIKNIFSGNLFQGSNLNICSVLLWLWGNRYAGFSACPGFGNVFYSRRPSRSSSFKALRWNSVCGTQLSCCPIAVYRLALNIFIFYIYKIVKLFVRLFVCLCPLSTQKKVFKSLLDEKFYDRVVRNFP